MNRRGFFGTLFGLAIAPAIAVKVLSAPPKPTLLGFKGTQYMETGYVYTPYIPLVVTSCPIESKVKKIKDNWTVELEQDLECYHMSTAMRKEIDKEILRQMESNVV